MNKPNHRVNHWAQYSRIIFLMQIEVYLTKLVIRTAGYRWPMKKCKQQKQRAIRFGEWHRVKRIKLLFRIDRVGSCTHITTNLQRVAWYFFLTLTRRIAAIHCLTRSLTLLSGGGRVASQVIIWAAEQWARGMSTLARWMHKTN